MLICSECGKKVVQIKATGALLRPCGHQGPVVAQLKATVKAQGICR